MKSAQVLGHKLGLTAEEVNFALKEAGLLSGNPGAYGVTELGAKFAAEQHHHRCTGGYAHYNRHWETRTWDESVVDLLDLTADRMNQIRKSVADARRAVRAARNGAAVAAAPASTAITTRGGASVSLVKRDHARLAAAAAAAYGIYKAVPFVQRFWVQRAAPGLRNLKSRAEPELDEVGAADDSGGNG